MPPDTIYVMQAPPTDYVALSAQVLAALGAAGAVLVAWWQLSRVADTIEEAQKANLIASNGAFVQVEMMLFGCLTQIDLASAAILRMEGRQEKGEEISHMEKEAVKMEYNGAIQNYLNSLDRLCASVMRGVISYDDAQRDYELALEDAVKNYGKHKGIDDFEKHFTNIIALRKDFRERRWKR